MTNKGFSGIASKARDNRDGERRAIYRMLNEAQVFRGKVAGMRMQYLGGNSPYDAEAERIEREVDKIVESYSKLLSLAARGRKR